MLLTRQKLEDFDTNAIVGDDRRASQELNFQLKQIRVSAGAIGTFVGTTRDHFENKKVLRLEYEAYEPMAEKELKCARHSWATALSRHVLRALCTKIRARWQVKRVAVLHRLGPVEVGEVRLSRVACRVLRVCGFGNLLSCLQASVVIAVSSEHRREALEAVHALRECCD